MAGKLTVVNHQRWDELCNCDSILSGMSSVITNFEVVGNLYTAPIVLPLQLQAALLHIIYYTYSGGVQKV